MACAAFIMGNLLSPYLGIPGPILMIVGAAILKVSKVIPARMELGAYQMYKFMSANLTFAILIGLGALFVSWNDLVKAMTFGYLAVCVATVSAMVAAGFFIGPWLKMYPVESGIVTACHSGLGGTGDVAILSASNRMGLMPFAQISTAHRRRRDDRRRYHLDETGVLTACHGERALLTAVVETS